MNNKKLKVGFVGLGLMGRLMALNIYKAGYPLSVYNRNPKRLKDFQKLAGIKIFDSPSELSKNVEVVISMVTGPKDVEEVYLGKNGVVWGAGKNLVAIDMSTIGPGAAINIGKKLGKKGVKFLDAPVTGSTNKAESGELTILVGGDKKLFNKVKPLLKVMGRPYYLGPSGKGQALKLVNNLMGAITVEALAEGMLLADKLGIKRKVVMEVLGEAPLISLNMKWKMPNMISNKHPVAFSVANMRKDLRLAIEEAASKNPKSFPNLISTEKLLAEAMKKGLSNNDYSAVLEVLK